MLKSCLTPPTLSERRFLISYRKVSSLPTARVWVSKLVDLPPEYWKHCRGMSESKQGDLELAFFQNLYGLTNIPGMCPKGVKIR